MSWSKVPMPNPKIIPATITSLIAALAAPALADGWTPIETVAYEERGGGDDWRVVKSFAPGFDAPVRNYEITGYAVILEAQADLEEILLVPDASQCPFCGGGEGYGPTLSVSFARPIAIPDPTLALTVTGRLVPIADDRTYEAYRLIDARVLPNG